MSTSIPRIPVYSATRVKRRAIQAVLFLYAAAMVGCAAMVIGPALNDWTIESNPGRALAKVTAVTNTKTVVEYQDEEGVYHSPHNGLLYPTGLGVGQRVWINYAKTDPELAKVEGRKWTLALIPAASVFAGIHVVTLLLLFIVKQIRVGESRPQTPPRTRRITIAPRNKAEGAE
ncbi:hypothetical protein CFELI_01505 [Corynebacterium felinum]|uniref:DUF3592 domain-containing protein n=1 Tax=Corynebacterium felinum TaxID=131318 RepID=A0ABU2B7J4_9CORY|nr:hypothetical protein [Corynebacterium felinum]WJY93949.1 hypothetical protein CFELI_01505 [Corynebacterium felinum]